MLKYSDKTWKQFTAIVYGQMTQEEVESWFKNLGEPNAVLERNGGQLRAWLLEDGSVIYVIVQGGRCKGATAEWLKPDAVDAACAVFGLMPD